MKSFILKCAAELGFCAAGVTTADAVCGIEHLNDAIEGGRIASMKWLARNPKARCDPKSLFADARSVICLAFPYGEKGFGPSNSDLQDSKRARFARGEDYHGFVLEGMEELWRRVKKRAPDARAKFCVDMSPILEKALAERAGLGWIGKHTILVNENLGSWFVLCEIMTDLGIEPDLPCSDMCGGCRACIDACPTGAIAAPRALDSRRCISYLTIEHKGDLPGEFCGLIAKGQYGCDICQEVCPYNRVVL